ncbi:MAG: hypothetical protein IH571_05720 [Acholeplasmataceae bacterium]|nr:hypothetical protein [Acholeplasmataceae bacterium]
MINPMKEKKYVMNEVLESVARVMNDVFETQPILYGSYGLEMCLNKFFEANDIDLLVPTYLLTNHKEKMVDAFEKSGFHYVDKDVFTIVMHNIDIEISFLETWQNACALVLDCNVVSLSDQATIRILSVDDFKKLYTYLSIDASRSDLKRAKDRMKLQALD